MINLTNNYSNLPIKNSSKVQAINAPIILIKLEVLTRTNIRIAHSFVKSTNNLIDVESEI